MVKGYFEYEYYCQKAVSDEEIQRVNALTPNVFNPKNVINPSIEEYNIAVEKYNKQSEFNFDTIFFNVRNGI